MPASNRPAPLHRPPAGVVFVARTHWLVSGTIFFFVALIYTATRRAFEFGPRAYVVTLGLGALYGITGTLVWFGVRPGRILSRVCSLLYLPRPQLGAHIWQIMDGAEFKAHFDQTKNSEATKR